MAKKNPADRHLSLRKGTYWYQRRVPKKLQNLLNKDRLDVSLGTSDLKLARALRDQKDAELSRQMYSKSAASRIMLEQAIEELKTYERRTYESNGKPFIDFPLSVGDLKAMGNEIEADALSILQGSKDTRQKYGLTLSEAVTITQERKQASVSKEALQRYEKAAETFAAFLHSHPDSVLLNTVDRVTAHKFVRALETAGKKRGTIQSVMSRLKMIWLQASNQGYVRHDNPFENQEIIASDSREDNKTQLFDDSELEQIIALVNQQSRDFKLIIKILAFTGARPKEICELKTSAFQVHDGVKVLVIREGKTLAASRFIPLSEELIKDIETHCSLLEPDAPLFYMNHKDVGRRFSILKSKVIKSNERKVMYSLRVHFATAAQRAGVREDIAAQLVGHSNAKTLTFGYYSKGYEPSVLKVNYDKIAQYIKQRWKVHIDI